MTAWPLTPWSLAAAALLGLAVFLLLGDDGAPRAFGALGHGGGDGDGGDDDETDAAAARGGPAAPRAAGSEGQPGAGARRFGFVPRPGAGHAAAPQVTEAEVSSALALLALAYRSGLPTWDVLDAVAAGLRGPAVRDLRQVAAALRWGAEESAAWASVDPLWAPAARAVAIAHHAGVPPGPMLLAAADDLREAQLERLELSAARVGVRLVAPLGLVLLPAFCLTTVAPLVIALAGDVLNG